MEISKFKLGWTAFCGFINPFGSMVGNIVDYLLDVLNSALANLSDTTKEKIESVLATAKNVMDILLKLQFLVPTRWQYAYRETVEAVDEVIYSLEDIKLTSEELAKIKKEFDEAVRAWKEDDPVFCDKNGTAALVFFPVFAVFALGCGSNPAAYSVTQNNQFDGCSFVFGGASTNAAPVEMFTLAQNLENAGSQTADQTVKTDVSPEVAVGVGGSSAGVGQGGGTASGTFSRIGAAVDAVSSLIPSGDSKNANGKTESSPSASGNCADGSCSDDESACSDGSCSL